MTYRGAYRAAFCSYLCSLLPPTYFAAGHGSSWQMPSCILMSVAALEMFTSLVLCIYTVVPVVGLLTEGGTAVPIVVESWALLPAAVIALV